MTRKNVQLVFFLRVKTSTLKVPNLKKWSKLKNIYFVGTDLVVILFLLHSSGKSCVPGNCKNSKFAIGVVKSGHF